MSDPGKYRTKEEVEEMMRYDPLFQFGKRLMEQERFAQAELDALDKEVLAQIDEAVKFVEESPVPAPESLYEDVYVRSPYINLKAAERDPAWRAAVREDRVPMSCPLPRRGQGGRLAMATAHDARGAEPGDEARRCPGTRASSCSEKRWAPIRGLTRSPRGCWRSSASGGCGTRR